MAFSIEDIKRIYEEEELNKTKKQQETLLEKNNQKVKTLQRVEEV